MFLLKEKLVIVIDDGLATGATMRAAIKTIRKEEAKEIYSSRSSCPPDTLKKLEKEVDAIVCLSSPSSFFAVCQFYKVFDQTSHEEVIALLKKKT